MSEFEFFYGGVFSQWYRSDFVLNGMKFNCAEQWMMYQKAVLFGDPIAATEIMNAGHPADQKAIGRRVKNFDAARWNNVAKSLIYQGNEAKFTQNPELLKALLATGDREFVECSPVDVVWGVGLGMNDERRHDRTNWRGTNWLGEVLTQLRNDLRADK
jgi:ribA/ribD-fused uncharacterized protein